MNYMYQAFECYSPPGESSNEGVHARHLVEDPDTLKKYKALQNSVCFLCMLSVGKACRRPVILGPENSFEVIHKGKMVKVRREIDLARVLEEKLPTAMRRCPPACIGSVEEGLGVTIVDELDVLSFMECHQVPGSGILVDTRTADLHRKSTIPSSINIPYSVFHLDSGAPELVTALRLLAVEPKGGNSAASDGNDGIHVSSNSVWDFSAAKNIVLWCHGPMGRQSPMAIKALQKLGYPREKIYHYRGGMKLWRAFDLTTVKSD